MCKKGAYALLEAECQDDDVVWNTQNVTFLISIAVQFAVLVFSFVTLGIGDDPPQVLTTILWMETVVQLIEFLWYLGIGILFVWGKSIVGRPCEFGIEYRYADWFLTTPTMLLTLYFLLHYFATPCLCNQALTEKTSFVGFVVLIILLDWAMLAIGFAYERGWFGWDTMTYKRVPMLAGFVFLFCAFIPHFYTLGETPTDEGIVLLIITILIWCLYGVVAMIWVGKTHGVMAKNAAYNILDLLSKNSLGIVVSILTLTFTVSHGPCPACP